MDARNQEDFGLRQLVVTRKYVLYALSGIVLILLTDAFFHVLIIFLYGVPTWTSSSVEVFNNWGFTQRVDDDRVITLKHNYRHVDYIGEDPGYREAKSSHWTVHINSKGFRRSCSDTDLDTTTKVIFIGDSVPFGWGLDDESSAPYLTCQILASRSDSRQVINAAIPSYSLKQAVERYRREIHGREPVDAIYVQIYDPVNQVMIFGSDWKPEYSWSRSPKVWMIKHSWPVRVAVRFSSTAFILNRVYVKYFGVPERYSKNDLATTQRVRDHVRSELRALAYMARSDGAKRILVAPVTIPPTSFATFSDSRKYLINQINEEIQSSARSDPLLFFFDTRGLLDELPENSAFIDRCCHLSAAGARKLAEGVARTLLQSSGRPKAP